ncbi:uncharacterized protein LOC122499593 [Leptopilina heterotoma]|uniref:uncharacterized protein LOC122499593 n=1 Tax=Leptopilina heterotoma TaxID=63436 RepID=UPI001CA7BECB|nr:uncharacterized protein LOC122499593 [Leptopilina heterotoma]
MNKSDLTESDENILIEIEDNGPQDTPSENGDISFMPSEVLEEGKLRSCSKPKDMPSENESIPFTPSEVLKEVELRSCSIEIVGYVDTIRATRVVKKKGENDKDVKKNDNESEEQNNKLKVFSFSLNNNNGTKVEVSVWNKQIERIENIIKTNQILHIDGATAEYKNPNYNLEMEGYIKTNFRRLKYEYQSQIVNYGIGSITDGEFKIDVRIYNFPETEHNFEKGDPVSVTGFIKSYKDVLPYIAVNEMDNIKIIEGKERMPWEKTILGFKIANIN